MRTPPLPSGPTVTAPPGTGTRFHGLDALRAGALLLGVVLHSLMPFVPGAGWLIVDTDPRGYAMPVVATIHLFRMTTFLLLAGFFARVVVHRRGGRRFLRERAVRLLLPLVAFWPVAVLPLGLVSAAWHERHGQPLPRPDPATMSLLQAFPLGHLWFLWVLFWCCLVLVLGRWILLRVGPSWVGPATDRLARWTTGPGAILLLALPYVVAQVWQAKSYAGITEPATLAPDPSGLLAYGTAVGAGWLLAHDPDGLRRVAGRWIAHLGVAIATTAVTLALAGLVGVPAPSGRGRDLSLAVVSAVAAWAWTYGLVGLCVTHLRRERAWVRYLADASYWVYLLHLVLLVGIGGRLTHLTWPAELKIAVTVAVTTVVLGVTYDGFVRSTWLGAWLTGHRRPRAVVFRRPAS